MIAGGWWWVADLLSECLDPDEREAVYGDLVESGYTGRSAAAELLTLVVRRQLAPWRRRGPWVALVLMALPVGVLLSHIARSWAEAAAIDAWLYIDQWTWGFLASAGARSDLASTVVRLLSRAFTLSVWAWTCGWALGSLSKPGRALVVLAFAVAVFSGTLGSVTAGSRNPANAIVFSSALYNPGFPLILRTILVGIALCGFQQSWRGQPLFFKAVLLWVTVLVAVTVLASPSVETAVLASWPPLWPFRHWWLLHVMTVAMIVPAAYILATTIGMHSRRVDLDRPH